MTRLAWLATAALLLPLTGCGSDDDATLTVLAAASLTDVFETLAEDFESEHDIEVEFSFGSSSALAEQAADGAPGDVLATADPQAMTIAEEAGVVEHLRQFTANKLVLITSPGSDVTGLGDLRHVSWVRCTDEAPCGRVARELLDDEGVTADPVSLEDDVKAVLDRVVSGEAEAGLVYRTDARAAGDRVRTVQIPGALRHLASYRVATLDQARDRDLALAWVELLTSEPGRAALRDAGFVMP